MEKPTPRLNLPNNIVLASGSPRRKELLDSIGVLFTTTSSDVEEKWPDGLSEKDIAEYLAKLKAREVLTHFPDQLIIAADTIVVNEHQILGKPQNPNEASKMLRSLSGKSHEVITGVCMLDKNKISCFSDTTQVRFMELGDEEIEYYIHHFQPFDKAGAYGIQEWLGMIGVDEIRGSYFNVMGLPIHKVYQSLKSWN